MKLKFLPLIALAVANVCAHADTVTRWAYDDTPTTTKFTESANGGRFSTVGSITTSFATGVASAPYAATQALNTAGYAAQGAGSLSQGVEFDIDTSGYTNLVLSFNQRNSSTASAWTELQYTVNGTDWLVATDLKMSVTDASFVSVSYDFSSISDANNNASFGVRMLSMFAPGTSAYVASGTTGTTTVNYSPNGTIRYDNVLLAGTAITDTSPVPEPHTYTLMLGGLMAFGLVARRRRAN
ncbi:PEP-CTERM sorting domain-containing protein [Burkholderiaceae bacterium UC74_6]